MDTSSKVLKTAFAGAKEEVIAVGIAESVSVVSIKFPENMLCERIDDMGFLCVKKWQIYGARSYS